MSIVLPSIVPDAFSAVMLLKNFPQYLLVCEIIPASFEVKLLNAKKVIVQLVSIFDSALLSASNLNDFPSFVAGDTWNEQNPEKNTL